MDGCRCIVPENCNGCKFKEAMSRHWELEDYCVLNGKEINRMVMEEDCPIAGNSTVKSHSTNLRSEI